MNVLVIDIGTSSMRGILFDQSGKGKIKLQIKYHPNYKKNGIVEQVAEELEAVLCRIISEIVKQAKIKSYRIDMLTLTSQRSSVTAVDKQGNPLRPFIMWQDMRNNELCERLRKSDQEIFHLSGAYVNTVFSGSKMAWILENQSAVKDKIYKFTNIPEFLIYRMTGNFCTDHTYGSRTNLMNIRNRKWDSELLRLFQINEDMLCRLKPPGSCVGHITKNFAERTSLTEGIPVISAGGDQQCAALGTGVYKPGNISVVTGTGAFLMTVCDTVPEKLKGDVICNASSLNGQYTLEASMLTCCSAFDWFRDNFYEKTATFEQFGQILQKQYERISDCIVLPYFQGRATPDWNDGILASFHNVSLATTRDELLTAMLLGIFIEIKNNIDCLSSYVPVKEGFISGGMTQTEIINQMQADVYGIPLYRSEDCESTAKGALISSLVGQKVCPDARTAFQETRSERQRKVFIPNMEKYFCHSRIQKKMRELYTEEMRWKKRKDI